MVLCVFWDSNRRNHSMYVVSATTFCPSKGMQFRQEPDKLKGSIPNVGALWSFFRCSHCSEMYLQARKCEVRVTVRKRVDVLMSRSKHTIPHAQSSPRVNLSIGAKQGRYRTGQEGVEPKTRNRKTERKIKGCESPAREVVSENHFHPPYTLPQCFNLDLKGRRQAKKKGWSLDVPQICS